MKHIPLSKSDKFAIVDDADFDCLSKWAWRLDTHGYAVRTVRDAVNKWPTKRAMHIELMGKRDGYFIDHVNRDRLDYRRSNLRYATASQNQVNRLRPNASGFRGVSMGKEGRWRARAMKDNVQREMWGFDTPEAAARAYDTLAKGLHGEFAVVNFA